MCISDYCPRCRLIRCQCDQADSGFQDALDRLKSLVTDEWDHRDFWSEGINVVSKDDSIREALQSWCEENVPCWKETVNR